MTYKWLDDNHIEFQSELVGTNAKTVHLTELYGVAAEGNSLTLSNLNVGAPVPVDRFQRISRRGLSHFKVSPSVRRHYTTTQMNLVNYNEFAKLRLYQFEPTARRWEAGENDDADWEFMNSLWFDQDSVHFHVEFLRHQDEPDRVGAVCLYLNCQRPDLVARVLEAIHLPLRRGMTLSEVGSVLGAPIETEMPTARFLCGSPDQYLVSCRFEDGDCLNKVSIIRKDLLADEDSNA